MQHSRLLAKPFVSLRLQTGRLAARVPVKTVENFKNSLLTQGNREGPPPKRTNPKGKLKRTKGRNLLERLIKHKDAVLRFAKEKERPSTNNQAERDMRPAKIKEKMNGGFRASSGTTSYCRINSYISILRKQNRQVYQEVVSVIKGNSFKLYMT